jgi:hypothetical protein
MSTDESVTPPGSSDPAGRRAASLTAATAAAAVVHAPLPSPHANTRAESMGDDELEHIRTALMLLGLLWFDKHRVRRDSSCQFLEAVRAALLSARELSWAPTVQPSAITFEVCCCSIRRRGCPPQHSLSYSLQGHAHPHEIQLKSRPPITPGKQRPHSTGYRGVLLARAPDDRVRDVRWRVAQHAQRTDIVSSIMASVSLVPPVVLGLLLPGYQLIFEKLSKEDKYYKQDGNLFHIGLYYQLAAFIISYGFLARCLALHGLRGSLFLEVTL